jgi:hypothetical protein
MSGAYLYRKVPIKSAKVKFSSEGCRVAKSHFPLQPKSERKNCTCSDDTERKMLFYCPFYDTLCPKFQYWLQVSAIFSHYDLSPSNELNSIDSVIFEKRNFISVTRRPVKYRSFSFHLIRCSIPSGRLNTFHSLGKKYLHPIN